MSEDPTNLDLFSIGGAADESGVAPDTIRIWERRYGRPRPVRLPSGHRRYAAADVRWLRRMAEALSRGHRPSRVVHLSDAELDALLDEDSRKPGDPRWLLDLLALSREYRRTEIEETLEAEFDRLGAARFLRERLGPLVTRVGREWADGAMQVRHEHFLSGLIEDLLRRRRTAIEPEEGPVVILAGLSGEQHDIGIQMAALQAALAGTRPRILGPDSPNEEIAAAAEECDADVVAISVSLATGGVRTDRVLAALRRALPDDVRLVVGGQGARGSRRGPRGIDYVSGLDEFADRLTEWA